MQMMVRVSTWLLFFMLMTVSCLDEPDCYSLNNYIIGIGFKKISTSKGDTVVFKSVTTEEPPLLFYDSAAFSRIVLPLNYFQDETTFYFQEEDTVRFLRLGYTSQPQFVSENCGERFVLSNLRVLQHTFDSVRLVHDAPTRTAGLVNQIEIFR
jgi:hypothetical protein